MKIAITGSSGLLGSALVSVLRSDGHEVLRIVRQDPTGPDQRRWDPQAHRIDAGALDGIDAVVHLAGVGVASKRWSAAHKEAVLSSRVDGTTTIAAAVAASGVPVLVSASAVGWYGDRGDEVLDESDPRGAGFLADVVEQWEASTAAASAAGARVVCMCIRTGHVLSTDGGALGTVLPLFKAGLGGRLGSGRQWVPWIAMSDYLNAVRFLLTAGELSGPVNVVGPDPVRNRDYTLAIGRALRRPTILTVPGFALRIALDGFADEGALVSQRVLPRRLLDAGFEFGYADVDAALRAIL
ncbi:MAG TPA: TIGR01777 family oxidoreductase [Mycobacteriales bacterium]|nr:TIGR01777 family oxidoreductase [Mycobacteriales bacterium]